VTFVAQNAPVSVVCRRQTTETAGQILIHKNVKTFVAN